MKTQFSFPSSDPALLQKAMNTAREFITPFMTDDVVGIVFLGAITRGYFDHLADIDIAIFKKLGLTFPIQEKFIKMDGFEIQLWLSDYETELTDSWDMPKRWTYSQGIIHYDPTDQIAAMLKQKVPLKPEERKWLMMSGLVLSEWYINRLTSLWVERGNITSAHHMFDQGMNYFFDALFGLNNELVADMKWRFYVVERLERLPVHFNERVMEMMILHSFTVEELERRKSAYLKLLEGIKPEIENELQLSFEEMLELV